MLFVGTTWQAPHSIFLKGPLTARCAWWAPTPIAVVSLPPVVSTGGAAGFPTRSGSPWQPVHAPPPPPWTRPSMCFVGSAIFPSAPTVSPWQTEHAELAGCGGGGG